MSTDLLPFPAPANSKRERKKKPSKKKAEIKANEANEIQDRLLCLHKKRIVANDGARRSFFFFAFSLSPLQLCVRRQ
jgi:hypothetical protein